MKKTFLIIFILYIGIAAQEDSEKKNILVGGFASIGYGITTGNASEYFNNQILLPLTGDVVYKNLVAQLNLDGGYTTVAKTITFDDGKRWNEGDNVFSNAFGINVGYILYNSSDICFTPLIGYAHTYSSKKWWGASDIVEHEPSSNTVNVNLLLDFKNLFSSNNNNKQYTGLRISAGAYIPFDDPNYLKYFGTDALIYLSVGIVSLELL
jgi:hypothetical protein